MTFHSDLSGVPFDAAAEATELAFPQAIGLLGQLVKIPGIAWEAFDPKHLTASAQRIKDELESLKFFDWVELRTAKRPDGLDGAPAVVARRAGAPDAPHILLYAHHDVQPPGNEADWESPPFEATLRGDRIFGRGAADDKSGVITHITSIRVLQRVAANLRLGITVFIEGEEEAGSPSFQQFLEDNKSDLRADLIVVADSANLSQDTPSLTSSLRGLVSQVVTLRTLDHAVHSGVFGGPAPDAFLAMTKLLSSLHDAEGRVAVAGLASADAASINYSADQFRAESGMLSATQLLTQDISQSLWGSPAITVIGIDYPSVETSSNTLHPAVSAKISVRIAPNQEPQQALSALQAHLQTHTPFGAELILGKTELGRGYFASAGWASESARAALQLAWNSEEQSVGMGGTIPFIADLQHLFPDAQVIVTGVEDPDSRAHSPNESQHIPTLRRAILAQSLLLLHGNSLSRD
jgi:acetylornithine deacetylase/succinyl-diaminopimelate desuccinylase-like protein